MLRDAFPQPLGLGDSRVARWWLCVAATVGIVAGAVVNVDPVTAIAQSCRAIGSNADVVADHHVAEVESHFQNTVRIGPAISEGEGLGWAVHAENTALLGALNNYIKRQYRGTHYGVLRNKYFKSESRFRGLRSTP